MCRLRSDDELGQAQRDAGLPLVCYNIRCRYHNIGIHQDGRLAMVHPVAAAATGHRALRVWTDADVMAACEALPESCALDAANQGPTGYDAVGAVLGVSGEAIRQEEARYLWRAQRAFRDLHRDRETDRVVPGRVGGPVEGQTTFEWGGV